MTEFFIEYGAFLLKAVTVLVVFFIALIAIVVSVKGGGRESAKTGSIQVRSVNERLESYKNNVLEGVMDDAALKKYKKAEKAKAKTEKKARKKGEDSKDKKRVFVLDFNGDVKASELELLREEVTAVLMQATDKDEVVVRLESPGGMVHSYGLSAAQLVRIKNKNIPLTVCVDKVAASGGYMMACVADKIVSAPFAIMGSIGVVAQIPNFNKVLKKNDIDYELITAGEHKRTLTMLGENTDKAREKFKQDIEDTHELFKSFVSGHRAQVDIDEVANGDIWFGQRALDMNLVDELKTSDEYLAGACEHADVYEIEYVERKSFQERMGLSIQMAIQSGVERLWTQASQWRFPQ